MFLKPYLDLGLQVAFHVTIALKHWINMLIVNFLINSITNSLLSRYLIEHSAYNSDQELAVWSLLTCAPFLTKHTYQSIIDVPVLHLTSVSCMCDFG